MARTIDVVSLYPKDMNIYGDSGNVLTIRRRLELYGYEPVVHQYNQGDDWPDQVDLILGGGGHVRPEVPVKAKRLLCFRRPRSDSLPQTVRRC